MRWSVGVEATADRVLTHEEILSLADAVAGDGGIASGIGTSCYGATLLVTASSEESAVATATELFRAAVAAAGLPAAPITRTEASPDD